MACEKCQSYGSIPFNGDITQSRTRIGLLGRTLPDIQDIITGYVGSKCPKCNRTEGSSSQFIDRKNQHLFEEKGDDQYLYDLVGKVVCQTVGLTALKAQGKLLA